MDQSRRLSLKEQLLKRRERIAMTIRNLESQETGHDGHYLLNESYAWLLRETAFAELDVWYRKEINEVEQALERMEDENFGTCQGCNREIESHRLEHFPETEFCRSCELVWNRMKRL